MMSSSPRNPHAIYYGRKFYKQRADRLLKRIGATRVERAACELAAHEMLQAEEVLNGPTNRRDDQTPLDKPIRHLEAICGDWRRRVVLCSATIDLACHYRGRHVRKPTTESRRHAA